MAGVATPELAAAVSNAGALGSIGAGYLNGAGLTEALRRTRALTEQPFLVNLFVPEYPTPSFSQEDMAAALAELQPLLDDLGLPAPTLNPPYTADNSEQLAALLAQPPAAVSFTFGLPDVQTVRGLQAKGTQVWLTVTSPAEAQAAAALTPDGLVAQGGSAGGHRGSWQDDALADTLTLTAQVRTFGLPVMAAGGLMSPTDVKAALNAGAVAAVCGTAFLLADEAGTSAPYRAALRAAWGGGAAAETVLTRGPSGRLARSLRNRLSAVRAALPYPMQNALTTPLRAEATRQQRSEWLSLWAGTGVAQIRDSLSAAELTEWLCSELGKG